MTLQQPLDFTHCSLEGTVRRDIPQIIVFERNPVVGTQPVQAAEEVFISQHFVVNSELYTIYLCYCYMYPIMTPQTLHYRLTNFV